MADSLDALEDCQLITRFCAGDKEAGDILCAKHQQKLLTTITCQLQEQGYEGEGAEDFAQEVWLALFLSDFKRLKRYDVDRGKFHGYLKNIAKDLIQQRLRSESRRLERKVPLKAHEPLDPGANDGLVHAELAEYLAHLTHQENRCLHEILMGEPKPLTEPPISSGNERVLKHRLQKKLPNHFDMS